MTPERIAIVHHHLRPGGVTSVIRQTVDALLHRGIQPVVITGTDAQPDDHPLPCPRRTDPALAYADEPGDAPVSAIARRLADLARDALGGEPDLWHFHNHSLGKNLVTAPLVSHFAQTGTALLLQIHDFAEDSRPANYRRLRRAFGGHAATPLPLYPHGPHVHYALLNSRDASVLRGAGADAHCLHILPDPVPCRTPLDPPTECGRFLYPTRAIRRKNLGECILMAALAPSGCRFEVTLEPRNPESAPTYRDWVDFSREHELPVVFGAGTGGTPLEALMQHAEAAVTTSVAEGFGLCFLEPWLFGRPLVGRNLPDITRDLQNNGVDLGTLYERLDIPADWIDRAALRRRIACAFERLCDAYGLAPPDGGAPRAYRAAMHEGRPDFGRLDEQRQRAILRRIIEDEGAARALREQNPCLLNSAAAPIEANRRRISDLYGLPRYADRIGATYSAVLGTQEGTGSPIDSHEVLAYFLAPERFNLLIGDNA